MKLRIGANGSHLWLVCKCTVHMWSLFLEQFINLYLHSQVFRCTQKISYFLGQK